MVLRDTSVSGFGVMNNTSRGLCIRTGDFITTSSISGYGQEQDGDILRNYTLGKAIETGDWDGATETVEYNGQRFKVYLIGVVYTSG